MKATIKHIKCDMSKEDKTLMEDFHEYKDMGYEGLVDVCHRLPMGTFVEAMRKRTCWTKTSKINYTAHSFTVFAETGKIQVQLFDKNAGYFIRCIQKVG